MKRPHRGRRENLECLGHLFTALSLCRNICADSFTARLSPLGCSHGGSQKYRRDGSVHQAIAALAAAGSPLDAKAIAAQFKKTKTAEKRSPTFWGLWLGLAMSRRPMARSLHYVVWRKALGLITALILGFFRNLQATEIKTARHF
ncbi:MAG: hypothetical protein QOJ86_1527 [Bradyrhizobium sp.]|nr:hypothetical protein [Bradyrhizobium sp.]